MKIIISIHGEVPLSFFKKYFETVMFKNEERAFGYKQIKMSLKHRTQTLSDGIPTSKTKCLKGLTKKQALPENQ